MEDLQPLILLIAYHKLPLPVKTNVFRTVKLPGNTPFLAKAALKLSARIEDGDAMIRRLGDKDVATVVNGNTIRGGEFARKGALLGDLGEELAMLGEDEDAMEGQVRQDHTGLGRCYTWRRKREEGEREKCKEEGRGKC